MREFIQGDERTHTRKSSRMGGRRGKIHNSIFTFRKDLPIEKQMAHLFERRKIYAKKRNA